MKNYDDDVTTIKLTNILFSINLLSHENYTKYTLSFLNFDYFRISFIN